MIKRIILSVSMIPAILIILITATANRLMNGLDTGTINAVFDYLAGTDGMREVILNESGIMIILYWMSEYSHWIITICAIWVAVASYILVSLRRSKRGKTKKKV